MTYLAHLAGTLYELVLAGPIRDHRPSGRGLPGSSAIDTIIGWTMYGALVACVLAAIIAGAMVAFGNLSARPVLGERGKVAPFGVEGGRSAALNRFAWQTADGWASPPMVSKVTDVRIKAGERVRLETPGGGGFGHPAERNRDALKRDLRLGYVTNEAAARDYALTTGDEQ